LDRCLILNSPELRRALKGVYEGAATLTEAEWRALLGARRQLESAAARRRYEWLRNALAESGLPAWRQWGITDRLKSRDFTPEELEAEIQAARKRCAQPGIVEAKGAA
jgi:DNA-binding LacI/PurR family transcriptional regulator